MRCSSCRNENPVDARFCEQCGSPLKTTGDSQSSIGQQPVFSNACPKCGAETKPGTRFCEQCASPLPEEAEVLPTEPIATGEVAAPEQATMRTDQQSEAVAQPLRATAAMPEPVARSGRVCRTCGYLNVPAARFCLDCGEALLREPETIQSGPSTTSRVLGVVMRLLVSVLIASVTALATRYILSFVIGLGLIP
jgi:uncharacterized OB-fold protein